MDYYAASQVMDEARHVGTTAISPRRWESPIRWPHATGKPTVA